MSDDDLRRLATLVADELEQRGLVLPSEPGQKMGLTTPKQVAAEENITRQTVHNRINEWGLVRRDEEGYPKDMEGGATYISWPAWRAKRSLHTRTVRRLAGLD